MLSGCARHQVLRPLGDEIPAQVRQAQKVRPGTGIRDGFQNGSLTFRDAQGIFRV
jgi:hypothetical protein